MSLVAEVVAFVLAGSRRALATTSPFSPSRMTTLSTLARKAAAGGDYLLMDTHMSLDLIFLVPTLALSVGRKPAVATLAVRYITVMATCGGPLVEVVALTVVGTLVLTMLSPARPGIPPRLRASVLARYEWTLAVESWVSLLTQGLPALDQASGRGGAAPAARCRAAADAVGRSPPLLLRSYHGPPIPHP